MEASGIWPKLLISSKNCRVRGRLERPDDSMRCSMAPRKHCHGQVRPPKASPKPAPPNARCRSIRPPRRPRNCRCSRTRPAARLRHPVPDSRIHLPLPAHRPTRFRALHHRHDGRQALRRAEEPEDVHVELPERRLPREGHQRHPRRHRRRDPAALRAHHRQWYVRGGIYTNVVAEHRKRAGRRRRRSNCPRPPAHRADADLGKSAAARRRRRARPRPAPYNAER